MPINVQPQLIYLAAASVFVLVACLWIIGVVVWQMLASAKRQRLAHRLGYAQGLEPRDAKVLRLWHEGKVRETLVSAERTKTAIARKLQVWRRFLGWELSLGTFLLGLTGSAIAVFVVVYALSGDIILSTGAISAVLLILDVLANGRAKKNESRFEQQLADALALAARSLRAGHPLLTSFQLVVDEMDPPVSDVFAEIVQQQALGKSLEEAITTTAFRHESADLRLFAASISVQIRSGGNVADMMDRLIEVIRDRIRLQRRARVLTSQTQLSKRILIAVPIFLFLFLWFSKPDYLEPLYTTSAGKTMLVIAGACLLLGAYVMNKIAELKY